MLFDVHSVKPVVNHTDANTVYIGATWWIQDTSDKHWWRKHTTFTEVNARAVWRTPTDDELEAVRLRVEQHIIMMFEHFWMKPKVELTDAGCDHRQESRLLVFVENPLVLQDLQAVLDLVSATWWLPAPKRADDEGRHLSIDWYYGRCCTRRVPRVPH